MMCVQVPKLGLSISKLHNQQLFCIMDNIKGQRLSTLVCRLRDEHSALAVQLIPFIFQLESSPLLSCGFPVSAMLQECLLLNLC